MADNAELIRFFYEAFDHRDGDAMAALYAPDAAFEDPAFGRLTGAEAGDMWRMLTSRAEDLDVELAEHEADADSGSARWIARYTFTRTGRPVVNEVRARFRFSGGRIVEHIDSFSFWRWSRQALGLIGALLGWAPPLRASVRRRARADLARFRGES
jgi:ketosteroid isomerase-like protein